MPHETPTPQRSEGHIVYARAGQANIYYRSTDGTTVTCTLDIKKARRFASPIDAHAIAKEMIAMDAPGQTPWRVMEV